MNSKNLGRGLVSLALGAVLSGSGCSAQVDSQAEEDTGSVSEAINHGPLLYVVGNTTLSAGDEAARVIINSNGFGITIKSAAQVTTADANNCVLVIVSSSVISGDVNTKFKSVAVPVLTWESGIFDDLAMVKAGDLGTTGAQTKLKITSPDVMSAGLSGSTSVESGSATFSWGKPAAGAVITAQLDGDATKAAIFRYEKGAAMVGVNAPARRVGFYFEDTAASLATTAGQQLFSAAIRWASNLSGLCTPGAKECLSGATGYSTRTCSADGIWTGSACPGDAPNCNAGVCSGNASCNGLTRSCGPNQNDSCCQSSMVGSGQSSFLRSYDGDTWSYNGYPASVTAYRLDKYEVTVGRFKKFITAWTGGWRPAAGAGKHKHLNSGNGLKLGDSSGTTYEKGWVTADNSKLAATAAAWTTNLGSSSTYFRGIDNLPIDAVSWYEAAAFCIWDNGFLPSESEWNFAASRGSSQYVWPWGNTDPDATRAVYNDNSGYQAKLVGSLPAGNSAYGQSDMAGNVWEWMLDQGDGWPDGTPTPYPTPCVDCETNSSIGQHIQRGGSYDDFNYIMKNGHRAGGVSDSHNASFGFRCARQP